MNTVNVSQTGRRNKSEFKMLHFALPINLYHDANYSARLAQVCAAFPAHERNIVEPPHFGWTPEQWRQTWNEFRERLAALVVWTRSKDTSICYGCLKEIEDVQERGIPVYVVTEAGMVLPLKSIRKIAGVDRKPALWHRTAFVEMAKG